MTSVINYSNKLGPRNVLNAMGITITEHCNAWTAFHVHDALNAGTSNEEKLEMIGVTILMGNDTSMVFVCVAMETLNEFEQEHPLLFKPY